MSRISVCQTYIDEYSEKIEKVKNDIGRIIVIEQLMASCDELTTIGFRFVKDGRTTINSKDREGNCVLSGVGRDSKNSLAKAATNRVYTYSEEYNTKNALRIERLSAGKQKLERILEGYQEELAYRTREKEIAEAVANDETPPARVTRRNTGGNTGTRVVTNNTPRSNNGRVDSRANAIR